MTRKEFVERMALMGIGVAVMPGLLNSCRKDDDIQVTFTGKVLIIGAGSAGLMAGYTLQQHGIDFEILEGSDRFGGRVRKNTTLADFPIDLGAEWIHEKPRIFKQLINDESAEGGVDVIPYNPSTIHYVTNDGKKYGANWISMYYGENKFKRSTWYDFFDQYIVPNFANKIRYQTPVRQIDYSGSEVKVVDDVLNIYSADRVIVTVPIPILRDGYIGFNPDLPSNKKEALNQVSYPDGIKVFMKFSQRFYPDLTYVDPFGNGESIYYDAAYKKDSGDHILALFSVSDTTGRYTDIASDQELIDYILAELDAIFDGQASQHYLSHVTQNWSKEALIQGSYSHYGSERRSVQSAMNEPLNGKVYFAGEAWQTNSNATVHGAGLNGREVAETILQS